jgi:hypothetical protein
MFQLFQSLFQHDIPRPISRNELYRSAGEAQEMSSPGLTFKHAKLFGDVRSFYPPLSRRLRALPAPSYRHACCSSPRLAHLSLLLPYDFSPWPYFGPHQYVLLWQMLHMVSYPFLFLALGKDYPTKIGISFNSQILFFLALLNRLIQSFFSDMLCCS